MRVLPTAHVWRFFDETAYEQLDYFVILGAD